MAKVVPFCLRMKRPSVLESLYGSTHRGRLDVTSTDASMLLRRHLIQGVQHIYT